MRFMPVQDAMELIRLEYAEMPGLQVTARQAQRLWCLSDELCARALEGLVCSGFLVRKPNGTYARPHVDQPAAEAVPSLQAT